MRSLIPSRLLSTLPILLAAAALLALASPAAADPDVAAADDPVPATEPPASSAEPTPPRDQPAPEKSAADAFAPSGWFRVDTDALSTQFWLGATHPVGGIDIASDIYVVGSFAEFDLGATFSVGPASFTPMAGVGFDFAVTDVTTLVAPQLFTVVESDHVYFENWIQFFLGSPFSEDGQNLGYTRAFALYKLGDLIALGPQAEVTYSFNDSNAMPAAFEKGLSSVPVGGRMNLGYGKNNTLGIFLGYDTKAPADSDGIAGRFTFVRTW